MQKGRVVAMVAASAAAVAGLLHLKKRRSGDADTMSPNSVDSMTKSNSSKLGMTSKKSPATA